MELKFELPPSGFKRLFFDIETSFEIGKFWRPSFKAVIRHSDVLIESAIICISYKWEGQKTVHSLRWDKGCDKELLEKFMQVALQADEIIGHNGDNFDVKIVRTRCLFNGVECPPKFNTLDTLKKARQQFKFDSNTLEYISKRLTGEGKTPMEYEDWNLICLPLIPLRLGYPVKSLPKTYYKALSKMVKYCEVDVLKLEEVFHYIQPYIEHNHHAGEKAGFGRYSCPKCGNDQPKYHMARVTKAGTKRHTINCPKGCGFYTVSNAVWMQKLKADLEEKLNSFK
jgi:hypothetical protein